MLNSQHTTQNGTILWKILQELLVVWFSWFLMVGDGLLAVVGQLPLFYYLHTILCLQQATKQLLCCMFNFVFLLSLFYTHSTRSFPFLYVFFFFLLLVFLIFIQLESHLSLSIWATLQRCQELLQDFQSHGQQGVWRCKLVGIGCKGP